MSINTAEIPQIDGDLDVVDAAGGSPKTAGTGFADTGSDVHTTWQGLSGVYKAPEVGELLAATAPVSADSSTIGSDVRSVGSALSAYASEVRPIKAELERLRTEAVAYNATIEGDDEWTKDEDLVNQKNGLLKSVNAAVAAWQAAERTCASAINATFGGVQYRADDGDSTTSADEYGYSAETLDGATAGDQGVPWGKASEVDEPWYKDVANSVVSFGKGLVVDGLWGTVRGLGTMVGVDGAEAAGQAWMGIGKLAMSLNPVAMAVDQTVGIPGMEKGELGATQLAAGKAPIAYDTWGEDPARASGVVVGTAAKVGRGDDSDIPESLGAGREHRRQGQQPEAEHDHLPQHQDRVVGRSAGDLRAGASDGRCRTYQQRLRDDLRAEERGIEFRNSDAGGGRHACCRSFCWCSHRSSRNESGRRQLVKRAHLRPRRGWIRRASGRRNGRSRRTAGQRSRSDPRRGGPVCAGLRSTSRRRVREVGRVIPTT